MIEAVRISETSVSGSCTNTAFGISGVELLGSAGSVCHMCLNEAESSGNCENSKLTANKRDYNFEFNYTRKRRLASI
jgi:hypothetical protein